MDTETSFVLREQLFTPTLPPIAELEMLHNHICQAVGDPRRIQILYALHQKPNHASALAEALGITQPTASRHLNLLRQKGLVLGERQGAAMIYRLADPQIITVLEIMRRLLRSAIARQTQLLALED